MIFITERKEHEDEIAAAGDWNAIMAEAAKYHRAKVVVEEYSDKDEISEQQRKWLHCEAGPIRELMRSGWSFREAKEHLKVEYGRHIFVVELTDDNFRRIKGVFRWECKRSLCHKLIHPMDIIANAGKVRLCPYCQHVGIKPLAIKSIMDISVKKTNLWFDEIFAHFPKIQPPDKEWKKKLKC